jgi:hypothetical protein
MPPSSSSIIPLPPVVIILTVISIVGAVAIPFGDPQFIDRAIALELSFVTLAIVILLGDRLTVRRVPLAKLALYACIPLAIIVMVGNSLASPHVEMMVTKSKVKALLVRYYYYNDFSKTPSPFSTSLLITIHICKKLRILKRKKLGQK